MMTKGENVWGWLWGRGRDKGAGKAQLGKRGARCVEPSCKQPKVNEQKEDNLKENPKKKKIKKKWSHLRSKKQSRQRQNQEVSLQRHENFSTKGKSRLGLQKVQ